MPPHKKRSRPGDAGRGAASGNTRHRKFVGTGHFAKWTSGELLIADLPWGRNWCVRAACLALCCPLPVLLAAARCTVRAGAGTGGAPEPSAAIGRSASVSPPRPTSEGGGASPPGCGRGGRADGSAQSGGVLGRASCACSGPRGTPGPSALEPPFLPPFPTQRQYLSFQTPKWLSGDKDTSLPGPRPFRSQPCGLEFPASSFAPATLALCHLLPPAPGLHPSLCPLLSLPSPPILPLLLACSGWSFQTMLA